MRRPPSDRRLPLAPVSPLHDWIHRIDGRQADLTKLGLQDDERTRHRGFIERAYATSALGLTGLAVSEEQIARVQNTPAPHSAAPSGLEQKIQKTLASIRVLQRAVDRQASLTPDLLLSIHDPFSEPAPPDQQEAPPRLSSNELTRTTIRIRAFCDWAAADSFGELNALEQAAIIILRLLEIRPFEEGNVAAALGAASLGTMGAGWPPIIVPAVLRPRFNQAVGEGMKMNTRPLVDLIAESLCETLDSLLKFVKDLRG